MGEYLTNERQRQYLQSLGASLDSGSYDTVRKPGTAQQLEVVPGQYALGRSKVALVDAAGRQLILASVVQDENGGATVLRHYTRAFINGETVMGTSYRRSQKRRNTIVMFLDAHNRQRFAEVESFTTVMRDGVFLDFVALARVLTSINANFINHGGVLTQAMVNEVNPRFKEVRPPL